jgi:hypothetical protein
MVKEPLTCRDFTVFRLSEVTESLQGRCSNAKDIQKHAATHFATRPTTATGTRTRTRTLTRTTVVTVHAHTLTRSRTKCLLLVPNVPENVPVT